LLECNSSELLKAKIRENVGWKWKVLMHFLQASRAYLSALSVMVNPFRQVNSATCATYEMSSTAAFKNLCVKKNDLDILIE